MKNIIAMLVLFMVGEVYASPSGNISIRDQIEISFGVHGERTRSEEGVDLDTDYILDSGPLNFGCGSEYQIILKFGDFTYDYHDSLHCKKNGNSSVLTWPSSKILLESKNYIFDIIEKDIAFNDTYLINKPLRRNDLQKIIQKGYLRKDIGNNYFIDFRVISAEEVEKREVEKELVTKISIETNSDDITFESFYKDSSLGWGTITAVTAVVVVAAVTIYGGDSKSASDLAKIIHKGVAPVARLASKVGTSGAAATASGLKKIGGSMATGLFLVSSGLSAATVTTLATGGVYAVGSHSYSNLVKNSKEMITLPLPINDDGCDAYEDAIKIIEGIEGDVVISSEQAQNTIKEAISLLKPISKEDYKSSKQVVGEMGIFDVFNDSKRLNNAKDIVNKYESENELDNNERARKESLLSLLYFITNNYKEAKRYAKLSISLAKEEGIRHTLSSYIYATSSLYDKTFNYNELSDVYLKYAIWYEPDNALIPLLISIHLDRMMYRFGDGMVDEKAFKKVFNITRHMSLKNLRLQNYVTIFSHYKILIDFEHQKIFSLLFVNGKTIKNSPKSLLVVKKYFEHYKNLIDGANDIVNALENIEIDNEKKEEAKKQVNYFKELIAEYTKDRDKVIEGLKQDKEIKNVN